MKKKRNTRLTVSPLDFFITVICLAGMGISLYLFWKDMNATNVKQNEKPIGVVYFKYNTAQRRFSDKSVWEKLVSSAPFYNGDRIRTAAMSEAYAVFDDGIKIDIHENSLVQMVDKGNENSLNFINGSISIQAPKKTGNRNKKNADKGFSIQTGNKQIVFDENSSAVISSSPASTKDAVVTVTAGSVNVEKKQSDENRTPFSVINQLINREENKAEEAQKISAGNTVSLEIQEEPVQTKTSAADENKSKEKPEVKQKKLIVTLPAATYSITLRPGRKASVPFFWTNSSNVHIDFSYDSDFSQIIETKNFYSKEGRASFTLDFAKTEDVIFWRAVSDDYEEKMLSQVPSGVIFIHEPEKMQLQKVTAEVFGETAAQEITEIVKDAEETVENAVEEIIQQDVKENKLQFEYVPVVEETVTVTEPLPVEEKTEETAGVSEIAEIAEEIKASEIPPEETKTENIAVEPVKSEPVEAPVIKPAEKTVKAEEKPVEQKKEPAVETKIIKEEKTAVPEPVEKKTEPVEKVPEPAPEKAIEIEKPAEPVKTEPEKAPEPPVEAPRKITTLKPVLKMPSNAAVITENDLFVTDEPSLKFSWNNVEAATEYIFTLFDAQKNQLLIEKIAGTDYSLEGDNLSFLDDGIFYWTIQACEKTAEKEYMSLVTENNFVIKMEALTGISLDETNLIQKD